MGYVKPNHQCLVQCTTHPSKLGADWWVQLFKDVHADGCIAVLHKPKDVAQTRSWLQSVRDGMGADFYIIIMGELMVSENYIGRNNPNLRRDLSYALEIPPEYRTEGYPDGYASVHPEKCLMQYTQQTIFPLTPEFDFQVKMGGGGGYSWGQGVSVYDLFFGATPLYDGRQYFHVWDVTAENVDVPHTDFAGLGETSWEYIQILDAEGKLRDHVRLHNADITHEYKAWVIDRNVTSIVPIDPEDEEPYHQYLRFLMGYSDLINGFYSTNSAFPRNGIINPPLQERQNTTYGPDGGFDLHLMDTSIWSEKNTYETRVKAGTPNYRSYCWWRTIRDMLKGFYGRLMDLCHAHGVSFGWSSSDQKQWAFNMADELGDFADQRIEPVTAIPGWSENVSMPSFELRNWTIPADIQVWTTKKLEQFKMWRFNAGGGIIWWLSTLSSYDAITNEQRIALRDATDSFHRFWANNPIIIPDLTVAVVSGGSGEGRTRWAPTGEMNYLPIRFLDMGWMPLGHQVKAIPPETDLVYQIDTEWHHPSGVSPLMQPSVDIIYSWVLAGGGLLAREGFAPWLNIGVRTDRGIITTEIEETLRNQYSAEFGLLLPPIISSPTGKFLCFWGGTLEGVTRLYIAPLATHEGAYLLGVKTDLGGHIAYYIPTGGENFEYPSFGWLLLHKLFYWTANKPNPNIILISSDKTKIVQDQTLTVTGWLATEDMVAIPNEEIVLTVNGEDFLTTTSGSDGAYTFSLSFAEVGSYNIQAEAQRWAETIYSEILTVNVQAEPIAPPIPPEPEPVTPIFPKLRERLYPYVPSVFDRWDKRRMKSCIRTLIKNRFRRG